MDQSVSFSVCQINEIIGPAAAVSAGPAPIRPCFVHHCLIRYYNE